MIDPGLAGRVALVTGANQGIGAATAYALAAQGAAVFVTYFRLAGGDDPSLPAEYDEVRARSADHVVEAIRAAGGSADGMEADLVDPATPATLFDRAEAALGPVEILVNNASGWLADTFLPDRTDRFGRKLRPVDAASHGQQCTRAGPADRRVRPPARRPRRDLGPHHRPHLRESTRLPGGGLVRRRQSRPGELHDVRRAGTRPVRHHREHRASAGDRHRLGYAGGGKAGHGREPAAAHRPAGGRRRGHHVPGVRSGPVHHSSDHPDDLRQDGVMTGDAIWAVDVAGERRLARGDADLGPADLLPREATLAAALSRPAGLEELLDLAADDRVPVGATVLAPVDRQPVWAAGVTFERSRAGRLEESGGADFYAKVYDADRPELFFKARPADVRGPGAPIAVRSDSTWDVPEPELGVVFDATGTAAGYVIGNDVSSRSIEAENPLYLPQAKVYEGSCALGPCVVPVSRAPALATLSISLRIDRDGQALYTDEVPLSKMRRTIDELAGWLFGALRFPHGAVLLTGTSIVPTADVTLKAGDVVTIAARGLGVLTNPVETLAVSAG
jgi:2-dehydro-3-deoxy-D-arabinonate dehydratase